MRKRVLVVVAGLAVGFLVYSATTRLRAQPDVHVGSILSLTGGLASYSELEKRGFDLAVKHINESGGINGQPLKVVLEESGLEPKNGISAFTKLTTVDRVPIIVGCVGSSVCLAVAPVATRDRVVVMSAGATTPKLSGSSPYFFRVAPSDYVGAAKLVEWALEAGVRQPAVLYMENDYGLGQKEVVLKRLQELGKSAVIVDSCSPDAVDLRPQIERIRKANPDGLFLLTHAPEAGYFLKQAGEVGFHVQVYGGDGLSDPAIVRIAGEQAEGVRYLLQALGSGPKYKAFAAAFEAAYHSEPDGVALKAYCLMMVAADALRNAKHAGEDLGRYISSCRVETPMGIVSFDERGDICAPVFDRLCYRNGKPCPAK